MIITHLVIILLLSNSILIQATRSDFYLGFFENYNPGKLSILLLTTDLQPVSYFIEIPEVGYSRNGTFTVKGQLVLNLPRNVEVSSQYHQNNGIHLETSSDRVTVIGQNVRYVSSVDTYLALPTIKWNNWCAEEYVYYVLTLADGTPNNCSVLIVGTEENTVLELTVTESVYVKVGNNALHSLTPGKKYPMSINKLQTIYFGSREDLSGTKIIANNPISMFSGHPCANIRYVGDCDHLIEQIPPTLLWDTTYYIVPLSTKSLYTFKVLAAYGSTNLDIHCNKMKEYHSINDGEYFVKTVNHLTYCVIHSNKKVLVSQFSHGKHSDRGNGDPMMTLVPATLQYSNKFSFSTIHHAPKVDYNHFVNIIVLAQYYQPDMIYLTTGGVNKSLDTHKWVPIKVDNVVEAYATQEIISVGVVEVIHADKLALMTTIVYGFANGVGYGHPGGFRNIPDCPLQVIQHPKSVFANVYSLATFECKAKALAIGNIEVKWKKIKSTKLPQTATIITNISQDDIISILKIDKIIHHYKGYYYCVVKNEIEEVNSTVAQLHVDVPCPEIIEAPLNITIIPGEIAKFNCLAYSHSSLKYSWKKKNSTSLLTSSKATECTQDDTVFYYIDNTQPSDEGWYCCVATNECGDVEECAWLEVDTTPVILTHPKSVVSKEGSKRISLHCSAHDYGTGGIQYKWEKYQPFNENWIKPSKRANGTTSNRLILKVITEEDEGVYRCIVRNDDGSAISDNATITVYGPPTIVHITDDTIVFEGNKTTLMCIATNDEDAVNPLTVVWYNSEGENLESNDEHILVVSTTDPVTGQIQSVLLFDPVNHTDSGECTCHAFNDKNCYTEGKTILTVKSLPVIFKQPLSTICKINKQCILECLASGIGHIQYKWERYQASSNSWIRPSHRAVNITSLKLIFSVITEEDEGDYHCIVSNHDGSVVSQNPVITAYGPPVIDFITNNTVTFEGKKINLICNATNDVDAINILSIQWYSSEGVRLEPEGKHRLVYNVTDPVTGQVQSVLLFDPVNHTDSGEYTCHAFNDNDCYTEDKTNLTVEYAPVISISPPSPHRVDIGDFVLLLCNAKGLPIPTVQWFLGDKAIKEFAAVSEQVYYVPTTSPHTTVYTCVSKNKAGGETRTVKANINVIVQPPPPTCPFIAPPENGSLFFLNNRNNAVFYCNPCYVIQGPPILICTDGNWNLPPPTCVKVC